MQKDSTSRQKTEPPKQYTFEALYKDYSPAVYSFAYHLTQNKAEAEDLFQDAWLRAATHWPESMNMHNIKAWIFTIVSNLHKDALRKKRVRSLFLLKFSGNGLSEIPKHPGLGKDLSQAMARLPSRQRHVFLLKEVAGFQQAEIGDILGIPLGTVKSLMHRAIKHLQRELTEYRPNSIDVRESNAV